MRLMTLLLLSAASLPGQSGVTINVDAAKTSGPVEAGLVVLRPRRAELHLHEGRQEAALRTGRAQPGARLHPRPQPADHRRRRPRAEVGLDQRLHRGRRGQARLRLDDRRPHLRHLHGAEDEAARPDRLHAARRSPPIPSRTGTTGRRATTTTNLHRLGLSAEGLRQVGRTGLPVGRGTASRSTARRRSRRGSGRSGTSRTSATGRARPRSTTSSTTTPPTP